MNLKSWMVVGASILTLGLSTSASARFPGIGGGKGASAADLDAFLNDAEAADALMTNAAWSMARTVLSDQEVKKLQDERKALAEIKDPKEKEAKQSEHRRNVTNGVSKVDYDATSKNIAGADTKKKELLSNSIWNYSLALLKDTDLVARGAKLVSGTPDPAVATRVTRLKGFIENMKSQIDAGKRMTSGIKKLQAASGLKSLPASASEKPVVVASGD